MAHSPTPPPITISEEVYNFIKGLAKSTSTSVKGIAITLFVYAVKEFFKYNLFSCPIENYRVYGSLFLYCPAVVLFCISLLVSESLWHLATGGFCCRRILWSKSRKSVYLAILPPLLWLIMAFGDAHYYVCAHLGPMKAAKAAANTSSALEEVEKEYSKARADSQIIAWGLLLSLMAVATVVLTVDRCVSRLGVKVLGKDDFEDLEVDLAIEIFNKKVKPMAQFQAQATVDEIFEQYRDEKPKDLVILGRKSLLRSFSDYDGLSWSRGSNQQDAEIGLTQSGPHKKYAAIN